MDTNSIALTPQSSQSESLESTQQNIPTQRRVHERRVSAESKNNHYLTFALCFAVGLLIGWLLWHEKYYIVDYAKTLASQMNADSNQTMLMSNKAYSIHKTLIEDATTKFKTEGVPQYINPQFTLSILGTCVFVLDDISDYVEPIYVKYIRNIDGVSNARAKRDIDNLKNAEIGMGIMGRTFMAASMAMKSDIIKHHIQKSIMIGQTDENKAKSIECVNLIDQIQSQYFEYMNKKEIISFLHDIVNEYKSKDMKKLRNYQHILELANSITINIHVGFKKMYDIYKTLVTDPLIIV